MLGSVTDTIRAPILKTLIMKVMVEWAEASILMTSFKCFSHKAVEWVVTVMEVVALLIHLDEEPCLLVLS
jgi:hypothetical protein